MHGQQQVILRGKSFHGPVENCQGISAMANPWHSLVSAWPEWGGTIQLQFPSFLLQMYAAVSKLIRSLMYPFSFHGSCVAYHGRSWCIFRPNAYKDNCYSTDWKQIFGCNQFMRSTFTSCVTITKSWTTHTHQRREAAMKSALLPFPVPCTSMASHSTGQGCDSLRSTPEHASAAAQKRPENLHS